MSAIQHNPLALSTQYLGPRALTKEKRTTGRFTENLAPSYVPSTIFLDSQKNTRNPVEKWVERRPVDNDLWIDITPDLRNHIDCRIQLIFQQFMLVYMTKLSFAFYNKADFQAGGEKMSGKLGKYVAAHDSTLPTLRLSQKEPCEDSVSFARNTSFYWQWNMTTYLPTIANQIDSAIDSSLREPTCKILNQVAAGDITPLEGLDAFLTIFLRTVGTLRKFEKDLERSFVLDVYADTAQTYYEFQKDALAQWLCFLKEPVGPSFYMQAQSKMHETLEEQMLPLKPKPIHIPDLPPDLSWKSLNKSVQDTINKGVAHPSETGMKYTKASLLSDNVRAAAQTFLIALHPLSPAEREKMLRSITYAKEAAFFRKTVQDDISESFYVSAPHGMDAILLFILKEVASRLSAGEKEADIPKAIEFKEESKEEQKVNDIGLAPPPIVFQQQSALKQLEATLQELAKKHPKTATVKKSLKNVNVEAVCQIAKKYLQYLCATPAPTQKIELDKIQRITTYSKVGTIGLSKEASEIYLAVRNQIVNSNLPEPRSTIHAVLIHLFADVINTFYQK